MSCEWKEYSCQKKIYQNGFCKQHVNRGTLLQEAVKRGVRICDDAKRACHNITKDGKLKCEECLSKTRLRENNQYKERKDSNTLTCTQCGVSIEEKTIGIHGHEIQKCEYCYEVMREIEENRMRAPRNYAQEKKTNPTKHYREYISGAASRNLPFTLSFEEFKTIVQQPCFYCKTHNEKEVIGVDRLNPRAGYIPENTVPCCFRCNYMKQDMSVEEFASYIQRLFDTFVGGSSKVYPTIPNTPESSSYSMRPKDIVALYVKRKLNVYIDVCEKEKRDKEYIEFLKEATQYSMTKEEFVYKLFKTYQSCLRTKLMPVNILNQIAQPTVCEKINILIDSPQIAPPIQWKVSNIYNYMTTGKEEIYKTYLQEANPEVKDIDERFTTLLTRVKSVSKEDGEKAIEAFVKELRNLRHNALCYKKNHAVIDREDREVWRAESVLHAFQVNKLDKFKQFTEEYVGDKPDDPSWCKRWEAFVVSVQDEKDEAKQKALISKFLTAQRTKKYRRGNS